MWIFLVLVSVLSGMGAVGSVIYAAAINQVWPLLLAAFLALVAWLAFRASEDTPMY